MIHITHNTNNTTLTSSNHQKFGKHILAAAKDQERNSNVRFLRKKFSHTGINNKHARFLINEARFQQTKSNYVNQDRSQPTSPI